MERLTGVAIKRGKIVHERGASIREHWHLRKVINAHGSEVRQDGDIDGFMTSFGLFVTRAEARTLAIACGQLPESWKTAARYPLSSDIDWDGGL